MVDNCSRTNAIRFVYLTTVTKRAAVYSIEGKMFLFSGRHLGLSGSCYLLSLEDRYGTTWSSRLVDQPGGERGEAGWLGLALPDIMDPV